MAAGFGHLFDSLPGLDLGLVTGAIFDVVPFAKEDFHLQMIEDGLSEGIDSAEERKSRLIARDYAVQHDPLAALAEIVLEFDYQRHGRAPSRS